MGCLRDILVEGAELAGRIHLEVKARDAQIKVEYKGKAGESPVTIADRESETALRELFARKLPEYNIIGEEYGAKYNGNGKVIVIDPLDCTKSFIEGREWFGPIISAYVNGRCVGAVEYNSTTGTMFVATDEREKVEHLGPKDDCIDGFIKVTGGTQEFKQRVGASVREQLPDIEVKTKGWLHVFSRSRVCVGPHPAYFHAGEAFHDFSAIPLFASLTDTLVLDHNGVPYDSMDFNVLLRKYETNEKAKIYCHPLLVVKPEYADKMLAALRPFKAELDAFQSGNGKFS